VAIVGTAEPARRAARTAAGRVVASPAGAAPWSVSWWSLCA